MGCECAGMRVSEQLVAQRLWHHQLDGITIPSDLDLVLEDDGGPRLKLCGPERRFVL